MVSAPVRVDQAQFAQGRGVGLRRACALTGVSRSSVYYRHKIPSKDEAVIMAMKELSGKYPRYGARRIRVLLRAPRVSHRQDPLSKVVEQGGLASTAEEAPQDKAASGLRTPSRIRQ